MRASLAMYDRPELRAALDRYWAHIRESLQDHNILAPETLDREGANLDFWRSDDLVLSQTCGMPYRLDLSAHVNLVGTPDFSVEGCPPGYYRSAIVVHKDDNRNRLIDFVDARVAVNCKNSQSGFAALFNLSKSAGVTFKTLTETGAHVHSAKAVANRQADVAALDAVTWRFIQRYDRFAQELRVLEWTEPTPGLPYICALKLNPDNVAGAVREAICVLNADDRDVLGLRALIQIPRQKYLEIPTPKFHS